MVEVEERQPIDDGAWDLLAVVEDKVVVACCGYEARRVAPPILVVLGYLLCRIDEVLAWIANCSRPMIEA